MYKQTIYDVEINVMSEVVKARSEEEAFRILKKEAKEDSYFDDVEFRHQRSKILIYLKKNDNAIEIGEIGFLFPSVPFGLIKEKTEFGEMDLKILFVDRIDLKKYLSYLRSNIKRKDKSINKTLI